MTMDARGVLTIEKLNLVSYFKVKKPSLTDIFVTVQVDFFDIRVGFGNLKYLTSSIDGSFLSVK
jgi:hypothetical protein